MEQNLVTPSPKFITEPRAGFRLQVKRHQTLQQIHDYEDSDSASYQLSLVSRNYLNAIQRAKLVSCSIKLETVDGALDNMAIISVRENF